MSVFKDDIDSKRVIFNIEMDIADRLEKAKKDARELGKKLDIDGAVNKAVEKFLKKAEKKLAEMQPKEKKKHLNPTLSEHSSNYDNVMSDSTDSKDFI